MSTEMQEVLGELRRTREEIERINKRLTQMQLDKQVETRALTLQQASKALSQGMTKTRLMVKRKELATIKIGNRTMVTMREIERLTTEQEPEVVTRPKRAPRVAQKPPSDLGEWLKTQRKKR